MFLTPPSLSCNVLLKYCRLLSLCDCGATVTDMRNKMTAKALSSESRVFLKNL
jgi:hypothetical protein